ncbi:MAG TPA: hypothetical protein VM030_06705 [Acidimicrobiales bacterium]|nr:hypothetical protein [Acidimicrobiales bacterium]
MPSPSRRLLALFLVAFPLLGACRGDVGVEVEVGQAGDGVVRATLVLDREARARFTDNGADLQVGDLEQAGWEVVGPTEVPNGGGRAAVVATKGFRRPEQAAAVLAELTGPDGPFRSLRVRQRRSFLQTRTELAGAVDLTGGLEGFGDAALRAATGSSSATGLDPADVVAAFGGAPGEHLLLGVSVRAPGGRQEWAAALGQRTPMAFSVTRTNWPGVASVALGATALLGLAVVVLSGKRRSPELS